MQFSLKQEHLLYVVVVVLSLNLQGCATYIMRSKKVDFRTSQRDTELEFTKASSDYAFLSNFDRTENGVYPEGGKTYKIRNESYLVTQSAEGYRTTTTAIYPTKFNYYKLIDLGLGISAAVIANAVIPNEDEFGEASRNPTQTMTILYGPLYAGWNMASRPFHIYDKEVRLPRLQKLPEARPSDPALIVSQIEGNIESVDMSYLAYKSFLHFDENKKPSNTGIADEDIIFDDLIPEIKNYLNEKLTSYGFQESETTRLNNDEIYLKGELSAVGFTQIGLNVMMRVTCTWELRNAYQDVLLTEKETANSSWMRFSLTDTDETVKSLVSDALESNMIKFIDSEGFQEVITDYQADMDAKSTEELIVIEASDKAVSLPQAVKGVATIVTEQGHGSGVLIKEGGYLLTNYHVVSQADSISAMFSEDQTYQVKVVRVSRKYDLALLKIDNMDEALQPLPIMAQRNAEVGSNVYAIGSPNDVMLGQTLSKGIISGRRDFDGRTYIQTDVSINTGNSGGALINDAGQLLGIVNAKLVGVGVEGIGFAIPLDVLEDALNIKIQ